MKKMWVMTRASAQGYRHGLTPRGHDGFTNIEICPLLRKIESFVSFGVNLLAICRGSWLDFQR